MANGDVTIVVACDLLACAACSSHTGMRLLQRYKYQLHFANELILFVLDKFCLGSFSILLLNSKEKTIMMRQPGGGCRCTKYAYLLIAISLFGIVNLFVIHMRLLRSGAGAAAETPSLLVAVTQLPDLLSSPDIVGIVNPRPTRKIPTELSSSMLGLPYLPSPDTGSLGAPTSPTKIITDILDETGAANIRCECELLSIDCLNSVRCLPVGAAADTQILMGVEARKAIKDGSHFIKGTDNRGRPDDPHDPIGKGFQYTSIRMWRRWIEGGEITNSHYHKSHYINETWYHFCREHRLKGRNCFFKNNDKEEDLGEIELTAQNRSSIPDSVRQKLRDAIEQYRNTRGSSSSALGHLLALAHMSRIQFNRQITVVEFYRKYLKRKAPPTSAGTKKESLRVSLHIRRGDACSTNPINKNNHMAEASPIHSPPQMTNIRKCYQTTVYLDALRRVQQLVPERQLEIFLSTDDAGDILEEIRANHTDLWESAAWNYLDYDRQTFKNLVKSGNTVEFQHADDMAWLGETAAADLWLQSHGQVFIGHLGSRFGKVGWLLATARAGTFVPYFTVDGHSFCCDIDEPCGSMSQYITSMENCMTFTLNSITAKTFPEHPSYWEVGNTFRRFVAQSGMGFNHALFSTA
jgi:hypothetical protein